MNENEIMNVEDEENEIAIVNEEENSGISTGLAMLLGSGLTLVGMAGFKFGKRIWERRRANRKHKSEEYDDEDVVDVDENDITDIDNVD